MNDLLDSFMESMMESIMSEQKGRNEHSKREVMYLSKCRKIKAKIETNLRRTRPMILSEAVRTLLDQPLIGRISVIDDDGYPHTIPIWFARDGDEVVFFSSRNTRK